MWVANPAVMPERQVTNANDRMVTTGGPATLGRRLRCPGHATGGFRRSGQAARTSSGRAGADARTGQSRDVLVADRVALGPQLLERGVHVEGVPQPDAVQDQAQGAELFLHADVVALVDLALVAVENGPAKVVAALGQVGLALDVAPVGLIVDVGQDVQALEDPPVAGDRLAERGGVPVALQHPDHVVGADGAGVDGGGHPQDVGPVPAYLAQVDLPAGRGVQRPVAGVWGD